MARNVILIRGTAVEDAGPAGDPITPGMLVAPDPSVPGGFVPHGLAGGAVAPAFARNRYEDDGAGIDTDIVSGGEVAVLFPCLGAVVNAVTEDTIAAGAFVESDGAGGVAPHGSGYRIGYARAASDLSGTVGRVEIVIAPIGA